MDNVFRDKEVLSRAKEVCKKKGIYYLIRSGIMITFSKIDTIMEHHHFKIFKSLKTFTLQGNIYNYFVHPFRTIWRNERTIEIPIYLKIIKET